MNYKINKITEKYSSLPYMRYEMALYMREIILKNGFSKLCELGHKHGKSSVYLSSIIEEQGFGHLWTFDLNTQKESPNINDLLTEFDLDNLVTVIVSKEGFVWDLLKLINEKNQTFDFCYIDANHTLEGTSMAFLLVDKLLDKNGIIVFDDYMWTVNQYIKDKGLNILNHKAYLNMTEQQRSSPQIKIACDLFIKDSEYELLEINKNFNWAIYKKR